MTTRKSTKTANTVNNDDALLESMLAGMSGDATEEVEVLEAGEIIEGDDYSIEAAVAEIEKAEAIHAVYKDGDVTVATISAADTPETSADAKPKKEKKAKAEKVAKEPKEAKPPRVTYHTGKASDVLNAKLGDKAGEMLLLEVADVELSPANLAIKQADLLNLLNARPGTGEGGSTQKKVAEKVVMLFSWMKNGGSLNEVMKRTITVLARDGEIVSGDKGNLHIELLSKPYSVGTCRAQAGQMMAMLPMLKIATRSEKGKLVANPDSLILMKARAELGLA